MKITKEFNLKVDGGTLESIKIDSSNSLIVATYKRDVEEFKNGDILIDAYDEAGAKYISILKSVNEDESGRFSTHLMFDIFDHCITFGSSNWDNTENNRLATDEEKQILFDALKKEGKRWNADKLEIEKLAPEFKRGDILASKSGESILIFDKYTPRQTFSSLISNHDRLSNDKWSAPAFRYASIEETGVFYKYLARMGKKWNAETLEIKELDISENVVDLETACEYLGKEKPNFGTLSMSMNQNDYDKFKAQITLQLMCEAWNKFDEFEADWENRTQCKHYPMFRVKDGKFEFSHTIFIREALDFHTSSFSFKTEERAKQFGEQFIDLFKIALGF